ncbi:MAG: methyl-accepting chemotaxis protein [Planctomycetota bacterium]|nr:methyl-accepting chemotaxis protein [Planctomycetota bacterium]
MRLLPSLGIRSRMLLLVVLPAVLILAAVLLANYLRMRSVLLAFGEEILADRVATVAADIDRGTAEAVATARVMAIAAENGLLGRRLDSLRFTRGVLERFPQFCGAYFGLEPEADGLDAATAAAVPGAAEATRGPVPSPPALPDQRAPESLAEVPPQAIMATGRFIPYWFRDRANEETILLAPLVGLDGLYYEGCRQRFADPAETEKAMITEPYDYEGQLMVEQTFPITSAGDFLGVAGVDRTLDRIAAELADLKRRQAAAGWHADFFLISRGEESEGPKGPRIIAATLATEDLRTRPIDETPQAEILQRLHAGIAGTSILAAADPITGEPSLFAAARVPTGGWTVVMEVPRSDIVGRVQGPLAASAGLAGAGMLAVLGLLGWITRTLTRRIGAAVAASRRVAQGDLTGAIDMRGSDETGQLLRDIGGMTASLRGIVSQVKRASLDLNATARQLSAAGRQQESAIDSLGTSTNEAAAASRQIAATGQELLGTMEDVAGVAVETARVADQGRSGLVEVGETMTGLEQSTDAFASRLAAIRQRAEDITMVITTITKVADQTNLLSINAAIEAEKAGQYGQGFLVVAREIRRLADQTAVATLDIERLVEQMQEAVIAGVGEMERFAADVKDGVDRVAGISGQFADVIDKVHSLSGRFEQVKQGMQAQAGGAGQISEALLQLTDGTRTAADALREFQEASSHMVAAVDGLTDTVSRFRVED